MQFFGAGTNIEFDGLDFPEGLDADMPAELLAGVQIGLSGRGDKVTVSFGQVVGVEGEAASIFIVVETTAAEEEAEGSGDGGG